MKPQEALRLRDLIRENPANLNDQTPFTQMLFLLIEEQAQTIKALQYAVEERRPRPEVGTTAVEAVERYGLVA